MLVELNALCLHSSVNVQQPKYSQETLSASIFSTSFLLWFHFNTIEQ